MRFNNGCSALRFRLRLCSRYREFQEVDASWNSPEVVYGPFFHGGDNCLGLTSKLQRGRTVLIRPLSISPMMISKRYLQGFSRVTEGVPADLADSGANRRRFQLALQPGFLPPRPTRIIGEDPVHGILVPVGQMIDLSYC